MIVALLDVIFKISLVLAWVLVIAGALTLFSLLLTAIYLILKRLGANLIGQAAMSSFLMSYYTGKIKRSKFIKWLIAWINK